MIWPTSMQWISAPSNARTAWAGRSGTPRCRARPLPEPRGTIPIALAESVTSGRLVAGMTILLVAFGAGFSWAAGLVEWGDG